MSLLERRLRWQALQGEAMAPQVRIGVLANFTADPIVPYVGTQLVDHGLAPAIYIGPYGQIQQQCLADQSEMARYAPDVLVVWPRLEELWTGRPWPLATDPATYAADMLDLVEMSLEASRRWHALLIFVLPALPQAAPLGVGDWSNPRGIAAVVETIRDAIRRRLAGQRNVLLADMAAVVGQIGAERAYDARLLLAAHIPFTERAYALLGKQVAQLVRLVHLPARKLLVVDGDNTLWHGVIGEAGVDGIGLADGGVGETYRAFQAYLLELRRSGWLLALCSKNEAADVRAVFERRDMRLQWEHLAAQRIGWASKAEAIGEMAAELGVAIDSVVFVDDNPAEVAAVQAQLPAIATILMPPDPVDWLQTMQATGYLDRLPPTAEDLQRAEYYQRDQVRAAARQNAPSPESYLRDLNITARLFRPQQADIARLSQLVNKINQFNLNGRRRLEPELTALCDDERYVVRLLEAGDRFGDYGAVGAYILYFADDGADIDTFVLSCRALGRGLEQAMLHAIWEDLQARKKTRLTATLEPLPRNEPARRFFGDYGCREPGQPWLLADQPAWPVYVTRS